ncbi:MAG: GMC family oxidoreductase N-terminal domain-containing protein [Methanobacteriaceae archaeon]|jgi:choline dehydrogenase-like flavoprotein|nr:GMC family oxidoreductase N-terminal domain-containing protein [Methanobacteriaceae archaeon]
MVIIVGSGAGGGLLAMELALANIPVTVIEKGPFIKTVDAFKYYDEIHEELDLLKTTCIGGSTLVSAGNAIRAGEDDFKNLGIDLSTEFSEVERLLNVHELDDLHIGNSSKVFMESAKKLGLDPIKMPKYIDEDKCIICGTCAFGCPTDAKWSSKDFVKIAKDNGAEILADTEVTDLIMEEGIIKGVIAINDGKTMELFSDIVILSAGAIDSSIILQRAGINAGDELFFDPFVTVGGILKGAGLNSEVQMTALVKSKNFILSPHFSKIIYDEFKEDGINIEDIFSIMVKIPDESKGFIRDGNITKINSLRDVEYIAEGCATAGFILKESGVDPKNIKSTNIRGAHPGGTAPIGKIVDNNLETKIRGLYVADASVFPKSPGAPPILTILALSKRLSKHIIN